MTPEYSEYLAHYGVTGQKWGVRQWQNADGTYTEAGKHHYGWGYGRQTTGQNNAVSSTQRRIPRMGTKTNGLQPQRRLPGTRSVGTAARQRRQSQAEIEARKARTRKILAIGAGVALTAALTYAAYKGSTKLRDNMRSDVLKRFDTNPNNLHTLTSKYWDSVDRRKYSELTAERAKTASQNLTRRDAVAAKVYDKTGIRVNMPQSRKRVLEQRRSEIEYSNFIRDAEKRGHLNKKVHDARAELRDAQRKLSSYQNTQHVGTSKQYEALWNQKHMENVDAARDRLNSLLQMRRAG